MSFAPIFMSIIDLSRPFNVSVNTYRMLEILHSKIRLSLGAECVKRDSMSYCIILNITNLDIALECFQIKLRKNGNRLNIVIANALNAVSGKRV